MDSIFHKNHSQLQSFFIGRNIHFGSKRYILPIFREIVTLILSPTNIESWMCVFKFRYRYWVHIWEGSNHVITVLLWERHSFCSQFCIILIYIETCNSYSFDILDRWLNVWEKASGYWFHRSQESPIAVTVFHWGKQ
jgi:hypothetical protein